MQSNVTRIDRRAVLTGAGATAAALAASTLPAEAASGPSMADLIQAHDEAHRAFLVAIDRQQEVERAYDEAHPENEVVFRLSTGDGVSLYLSDAMEREFEEARARIRRSYAESIGRVGVLSYVDSDMEARAVASLRKMEQADVRRLRGVANKEQARQDEAGVTEAENHRRAACEAMDQAGIDLLSYRCRTVEEAEMRRAYIMTPGRNSLGHIILNSLQDGGDEFIEALLQGTVPA